MPEQTAYAAQAAKCCELAKKAKSEKDRKRWLEMEQFWLRRIQAGDAGPKPDAKPDDVVEV